MSSVLDSLIIDRSLLTKSDDTNISSDLREARISIEGLYSFILDSVENIESIKDDLVKLNELRVVLMNGINFYYGVEQNSKLMSNALYGYVGAVFSRYYKKCVASDITAEGRGAIKMLDLRTTQYFESPKGWVTEIEFFNFIKEKYPTLVKADKLEQIIFENTMTVYGDTDSLFFTIKPILDSLGVPTREDTKLICDLCTDIINIPVSKIHNELLRRYAENRNCINMQVFELEAIMRRTIHLAKKKYVGSYLVKDGKYIAKDLKLKVTGLELAQKTTPQPIKVAIKKFVYYMLSSKEISDETYFKLSYAVTKQFNNMPIDEFSKSRGLGKYNTYHSINSSGQYYPLHRACKVSKGANMYNNLVIKHNLVQKYPLIRQGSKVKFYETDQGDTFTYPIDDNCSFPFEIAPKPDVRANLDKLLFAPLKRIMCNITNSDLSLLGSDVYQNKFSIFK